MLAGVGSSLLLGDFSVHQTPPGGCSAEQWAEIVVRRILVISDETCGPARLQAEAFRDRLRAELAQAFRDALGQQRAGLVWRLEAEGNLAAAQAVRALG